MEVDACGIEGDDGLAVITTEFLDLKAGVLKGLPEWGGTVFDLFDLKSKPSTVVSVNVGFDVCAGEREAGVTGDVDWVARLVALTDYLPRDDVSVLEGFIVCVGFGDFNYFNRGGDGRFRLVKWFIFNTFADSEFGH
jgi:hypothetical protein